MGDDLAWGDDLFRDTGHRLNLRVCVWSFYFGRMRNIIMAGPSTHLQFCTSKSAQFLSV